VARGGGLVPLSPRLTEPEADALLAHAAVAATLDVDGRSGARTIAARTRGSAAKAETGSDALAAIAYTSGTTGRPKGVELTHANLLWAAAAVAKTRRDGERSVAAAMSPLCHVPVFVSHYLARLLTGGTVILGAFEAERVVRLVREQGVTDLPLVPAMVEPLLDADPSGAESLVKITVGSAHTPMRVKQELAARFPRAEILEAYGQTETTDGLTMTIGREALERPGTVGRAHALVGVAILSPESDVRAAGEPGEIAARGPTIMRGYLDDPERTAEALRDGWLRTGDLGRLDENGYLFITGRTKELIISGGENVSPEEVETGSPGIPRSPMWPSSGSLTTLGSRSRRRWWRAPTSRSTSSASSRGASSPFKLPRELVVVARLPRTSAGRCSAPSSASSTSRARAEVRSVGGPGCGSWVTPAQPPVGRTGDAQAGRLAVFQLTTDRSERRIPFFNARKARSGMAKVPVWTASVSEQ
jgi:long-chain acyl-CoA synthetase